ncbi:HEAT repeat domain-containing protein [Methanobacterium aggregans]|uniref:HEAT repeat domain-containing protein n=1 Tax=Methanobacterium aggregans TaxID=1615586 RepID=UPI001AE8A9DF|nr:HEAT repeat domain-containing protein [Methanobacterium aggregans]MBP2047009.1 HEAT repeat protein [Methanobacterium aggregans]
MNSYDDYEPDIEYMEETGDIEGLVYALKDEDPLIRKEASIALKRVGDEGAVEGLIEALKYESWQDDYPVLTAVRENSAEALGNIGDVRAVQPLIHSLIMDEDEDVRWKSARALGKIGDVSAVNALTEALKDDKWTVRGHAAHALGNMSDETAFEALVEVLYDDDWHVRKYAAIALGNIGEERAIPHLLKVLNDNDADVSWKAIVALVNIGEASVEPLIKVFKNGEWHIRGRAAEALGNLGDERAVMPLVYALNGSRKKDRNKYIRGKAAEALGKIGDERAVKPLIKAIEDKNIYVRLRAEDALERIRSAGKAFWIVHYDNGEISFDYPASWEVMENFDEKKIIKGNCANSAVTFSINKHRNMGDITATEFAEILRNVFLIQNSAILSKLSFKVRDMDAYLLMGENPHGLSMTRILICAFKKKDVLYYLWFAGEPEIFDLLEEDMDLILESFQIHKT